MKHSKMTRRDFLQRFGAVGGSSLVFGAMDALSLMGQPTAPRPTFTGRARNNSVLVLGGGLTGLSTCHELVKLGYDARILEARNRVGGVNHTIRRGAKETELTGETQECTFDEGLYFNAGPWRIPNSATHVLDYCKELGVELQIFVNEHDDAVLYYEGEEYGALSGRKLTMRQVKSDMRGHTSELLAKAIDQRLLDLPLSDEDVERLVAYLVGEGYLETPDHVYVGGVRGGDTPYDLKTLLGSGFANRVRSVDAPGNTRAPMFQPVGGMDRIPMAFARVLGDRITLGAEVESIRQTEDLTTVVYRDTATGERHEVSAEYVVCCIPFSVLKGIDVELSPETREIVANTNYSNSAKIGVQMRRRFWEEDEGIYGGAAYTNLPLGQFAYPSNDYFSKKGVLLGFYGNDELGGINQLPVAGRIEHVIDTASRFHPQMREEFETGYAVLWSKIRYSNGAYTSNPGPANLEQLRKPEGRLYLGCAAVGTSPAWMQGAFAAALDTVDRLHSRVMAA